VSQTDGKAAQVDLGKRATTAAEGKPLLTVKGLKASYGPVAVLHGIDFVVNQGEVVVLLGANGAGKTTTIRALCGMVDTKGSVVFDGKEIGGKRTESIVKMGVAHVPQGRGTFPELSVADNLALGAYTRKDKDQVQKDIEQWYEAFPVLGQRRDQHAGSLSGGEQQMLAVARALMLHPKLLLLDEPSLGLAPMITADLFRRLADFNKTFGTTMFVVEQNAMLALSVSSRAYVLEAGEIVLSGPSEDLQHDDDVRKAYLGF
jgi:branched-chain amino acid transport system ATP-binding protein